MDLKILYRMYPIKDKRNMFIARCALTFGLNLDALSMLLGKSTEEVYRTYTNLGSNLDFYIDRLFLYCYKRQDIAISEFNDFFSRLTDRFLERDKEGLIEILKEIGDSEVLKLKKEPNEQRRYSDEEIAMMLKYQLKYFLNATQTANFFGILPSTYSSRVRALKDKYPELLVGYNYVTSIPKYQEGYWESSRRSRG